MVDRRFLTSDLVDAAQPPDRGERWISDTKLRGFGLRLWRTHRGEGKAFAIRTRDKKNRNLRRTYDAEARNEYFLPNHGRRSLGAVLDRAREWAQDEICRAKGRQTLREEKDANRDRFGKRLRKLTLDDLVQSRFRGMQTRGLTEQYILTLMSIYERNVSLKVRRTRVSNIRPRDLARISRSLNQKPGLARTLRSFLGQIIKDVGMHSMPLYRAFYFAQRNEWFSDERHDNASARQFSKENFNRVFGVLDRKVFGVLDRVQEDWLQAIFIRLLFAFNAPADRLMKAEWRHITEDRWYPWLKGERELWWCYARRINDETKLLLQTLHDRARNEFGDSHFLFPSKLSSTGHITTFQKTWRSVARECNLDRRDLTSLIRAYHRLNGPWFNGNPQKYGKIVQNIALRPE